MGRCAETLSLAICLIVATGGVHTVEAKSWLTMGTPTTKAAIYTSLAVHPNSFPVRAYVLEEECQNACCSSDQDGKCDALTVFDWLPVRQFDGITQANAQEIQLALHPVWNQPWVAYRNMDAGSGVGVLSLRNWDGTKWVQVGPEALTTGTATRINFIFNSVTLGPVLCFQDGDASGKASCQRFAAGAFSFIGGRGFTPSAADYLSVASSSSNRVFAAFQDLSSLPYLGRVMAWQSGLAAWSAVGGPFSAGEATVMSIAVQPSSGRPWVAFLGDPVGSPITPGANKPLNVVRWTGTQWVAVGGFAGAGTNSQYIALTFEPINSIAYVAYQCDQATKRLCVRAWLGGVWTPIGGPVSVGEASYINLKWWRYGAASAPYVAYSDKGLGTDAGPVVVKKWA